MNPFNIRNRDETIEVVAKITDSMVQEYGCRIKYHKETGRIDLIGEDFCREIVTEVLKEMMGRSAMPAETEPMG